MHVQQVFTHFGVMGLDRPTAKNKNGKLSQMLALQLAVPADDHGAYDRRPARVKDTVCEMVVVCDVPPNGKEQEKAKADEGCNPMMGTCQITEGKVVF